MSLTPAQLRSSGGVSCSYTVLNSSKFTTVPRFQCRTHRSMMRKTPGTLIPELRLSQRRHRDVAADVWPFDQAWGPGLDAQTLPQNLFAFSIIPYAGFLYHLTRSKKAPPLTLFGFYFLLVFVFATIPAGIYAKNVYGTSLANVDFLHGSAEFLLTLTNLFIVMGLRKAIREAEQIQPKIEEQSSRLDIGEAARKEQEQI